MSIKKFPDGRREVQIEVEIPGTPEQVWQAIATGDGVSSWFVPTEIDPKDSSKVVSHFGPGMDAVATVTSWDPPHRFAAESPDLGPGAPTLATEWSVEARDGGTCIVRVVHSLVSESDNWDGFLESLESGWPSFFRILRLYVQHFSGMPYASFRAMIGHAGPVREIWAKFLEEAGLGGASSGETREFRGGTVPYTAVVEWINTNQHGDSILLRIISPLPGIAYAFTHCMGEQTMLINSIYLYGTQAKEHARKDEPAWNAWLTEIQGPPNE